MFNLWSGMPSIQTPGIEVCIKPIDFDKCYASKPGIENQSPELSSLMGIFYVCFCDMKTSRASMNKYRLMRTSHFQILMWSIDDCKFCKSRQPVSNQG